MEAKTHSEKSFQDSYNETIAPKLKKIDIFLKTKKAPFSIEDISNLLDLTHWEIQSMMTDHHITHLNGYTFYTLMLNGSSAICRLFRREINRGTPKVYSVDDISYIYNIENEVILNACQELNIKEINSFTLPLIFSIIPANVAAMD